MTQFRAQRYDEFLERKRMAVASEKGGHDGSQKGTSGSVTLWTFCPRS
jgi:hypothetical protein